MATPDPTQPTRVSDSLMQALAVSGVTRLFALSGNQIMPLFDACLETDIEIVHTRHEAACVYMAEAHAQLTGELGVALVTAGAGLGNPGRHRRVPGDAAGRDDRSLHTLQRAPDIGG